MKHELQHEDGPTWCRHCGTFDVYLQPDEECNGVEGSFDSSKPENYERMYQSLFGSEK